MSYPMFRTSQDFTACHFDVVGHCFVAERHAGDRRAAHGLNDERPSGTVLLCLSLLLGIAVSADLGHAG